jgi:hypothetical protein
MNWISRKDTQIKLKRKHSNINILEQIASSNHRNVFIPNKIDKNPNVNQLKQSDNDRITYKIVSKNLIDFL